MLHLKPPKELPKSVAPLKGIGPTYMDKTGRNGLRVGDILQPDFREKYNHLKQKHIDLLRLYNFSYNIEEQEEQWFAGIDEIRRYTLLTANMRSTDLLSEGKKVLAEGAQGTMLDIDFGSYPFVTSSNTISAGACTGLGYCSHPASVKYLVFSRLIAPVWEAALSPLNCLMKPVSYCVKKVMNTVPQPADHAVADGLIWLP